MQSQCQRSHRGFWVACNQPWALWPHLLLPLLLRFPGSAAVAAWLFFQWTAESIAGAASLPWPFFPRHPQVTLSQLPTPSSVRFLFNSPLHCEACCPSPAALLTGPPDASSPPFTARTSPYPALLFSLCCHSCNILTYSVFLNCAFLVIVHCVFANLQDVRFVGSWIFVTFTDVIQMVRKMPPNEWKNIRMVFILGIGNRIPQWDFSESNVSDNLRPFSGCG